MGAVLQETIRRQACDFQRLMACYSTVVGVLTVTCGTRRRSAAVPGNQGTAAVHSDSHDADDEVLSGGLDYLLRGGADLVDLQVSFDLVDEASEIFNLSDV